MPRQYPPEFRERIVALARSGRSVSGLSADYGVAGATIYRWLDLTGHFTIEAWVQPDALGSWSPVLSKGEDSGSGGDGYLLSAGYSAGRPAGVLGDGSGGGASVLGDEALPTDGTWTHLALTSNGETLRLYVDTRPTNLVPT